MLIVFLTGDSVGASLHLQVALCWLQLLFVTLWECHGLKLHITCTDYSLLPTNSMYICCHDQPRGLVVRASDN